VKPTQEQVIAWAREAGDDWSDTLPSDREVLTRLATIAYEAGRKDEAEIAVAEAYRCGYDAGRKGENEACAKVCEDLPGFDMDDPGSTTAEAIRARREQ